MIRAALRRWDIELIAVADLAWSSPRQNSISVRQNASLRQLIWQLAHRSKDGHTQRSEELALLGRRLRRYESYDIHQRSLGRLNARLAVLDDDAARWWIAHATCSKQE